MNSSLPKELESQRIASVLSSILTQIQTEASKNSDDLVNAILQRMEPVTLKTELYYKKIGEETNKHQKDLNEALEPNIAKIENKIEDLREESKVGAKHLLDAASPEAQQRYEKTISPTSSSQT